LSYYYRKESDLLQLTAAEPAFPTDFQFDPIKGTIAFFMAEVIRKVVHTDEKDSAMFNFLEEGRYEGICRNQFTIVSGEIAELIKAHIIGKEVKSLAKQQRVEALEVMITYFRIHVPGFERIEAYEIIKEVLA
jgi:hypothetical protein